MVVTLPALFLLVVVVLSSTHVAHPVEVCLRIHIRVNEGGIKTVQTFKGSETMYLIPEQRFKGIILETKKGSEVYNITFPINETCYVDDSTKWNELKVDVKPHPNVNPTGVLLEVRIGKCTIGCTTDVLTSESEYTIISDGASKWRASLAKICDINKVLENKDEDEDKYTPGLCSEKPYNSKKKTSISRPTPISSPPPPTATTTTGVKTRTTQTASASISPTAAISLLEKVSYVLAVVVVVVVVGVVGIVVKQLLRNGAPPRLG
ncbi:hypothetical protein E2C01_097285 [Portunus trituberculatus]|uniref:Uncharacterized protein n=1 Tax=Portunus trituberculatus TaxID=210409 RepID=A0A5B7KAV2_PORTR|nr:hypothetical protein [Portunus trituberculatus]